MTLIMQLMKTGTAMPCLQNDQSELRIIIVDNDAI